MVNKVKSAIGLEGVAGRDMSRATFIRGLGTTVLAGVGLAAYPGRSHAQSAEGSRVEAPTACAISCYPTANCPPAQSGCPAGAGLYYCSGCGGSYTRCYANRSNCVYFCAAPVCP